MAIDTRPRWRTLPQGAFRRGLPLLLLLTALGTLFPAFIGGGPLHEQGRHHHHVTFNHLAVAKNLAAEHAWLSFYQQAVGDDGQVGYEVYNRFPPLGYFLIKLSTLTRAGNLAGEIQAARMFMLALYAGAAVLAYLSVAALTGRRYAALAATLTAFSSYALLHASDMVATEGTVDLFGTMLAFHGIACYQRSTEAGQVGAKPRTGQLMLKAGIALLLGWHVLSLLGAFVVLGLASAASGRDWAACRRLAALGTVFGVSVALILTYNLAREQLVLAGARVWALPSLDAMWRRSAIGESELPWSLLGVDQLRRIGSALAPYAAGIGSDWGAMALGAFGVAGVAIAAAAIALAGNRVPSGRSTCLALLPLAMTGILWAAAVPGSVHAMRVPCPACLNPEFWHTFEAMFHVGVPLALFGLLSLVPVPAAWRRALARPIAAALLALLWLAFPASAAKVAQIHRDTETTADAVLADMDAIRQLTVRKRIFAPGPIHLQTPAATPRALAMATKKFCFAGRALVTRSAHAQFAEFATGPRIVGAKTLTPGNQFYFLYPIAEYERLCEAPPATGAVALRRWCEGQ